MFKLICFDMDGVFFKDINFWLEVHKSFNTLEEGKILTEKYLHSDYNKLVEEVVHKLWRGKDATPYTKLVQSIEYLPGVEKTLKFVHTKKITTAIISASSIDVAKRVQKEYGIDYIFANELVIKNNKVSGEFVWPIGAGFGEKNKVLKKLCKSLNISLKEVIYVGDSYKDIPMFKEVGFSIAFNSDSKDLKEVASVVVDSNDLSKIIPILKKVI